VRAHLAVAAAAVLFGSTFLVVKDAVALAPVASFLGVRFVFGAALLAPFAGRPKRERRDPQPGLVRAGVVCGAALLTGYLFQTVGLQYTSSSVSAFVTDLLVVLVPVIAALWLRRLPDAPVVAGVVLATAGLLTLTGGASHLGRGELLTVGCAFAFAVHIVLLSELSPRYDTALLNVVQLAVVGGVCLVIGLFTGGYHFPLRAWLAAAYTGAAATALAFSLQVWGQRRVGPSRTSLLLMLEPVAAALLGALTGERLGLHGLVGAGLILAGIAVAEAPVARRLVAARS
jgi:drug/metabolite transporter (DMT)-like permease